MLPEVSPTNTIKKSPLAPTILISGGAGFIGSHLAEVLLQKEARVIVLDNFKTGKQIHVNHLLSNPKFALYDVNINEGLPKDIESVDYIFHLAGLEEYLFSKNDLDLDSLLTNALGTKNLLDLAKKSEAKFLLASTIDVYEGRMSQLDLDTYFGKNVEDEKKYSLTEAKRYAEALVWEYYKKNNTNVRIIRLPEVYGPRMSLESSGYLGQTLKDLLEGRAFTIRGAGDKKEYYLYVTDAISGMIKALLNDNTQGNIYSLIPPEPISALEIAYLIRGLADRVVEIKFEDTVLTYDSAKLRAPDTYNLLYLKWNQKIPFKDGIILTLNWFGYSVNQSSFKNSKYIEQKNNFGWVDFKPAAQPTVSAYTQTISDGGQRIQQNNESKKILQTPLQSVVKNKFKFPKITIKFPKLKFPRKVNDSFQQASSPSKVTSLLYKVMLVLVVILAFSSVFIGLPIYQVYSSSKKSMTALNEIPAAVSRFDAESAAEHADEAYKELRKARKYFSSLDWLFKVFGKFEEYKSISRLMNSVSYFSKVAYAGAVTIDPVNTLWESIKPESSSKFDPAVLEDTKTHIYDARNSLQLASAEFASVNQNILPEKIKNSIGNYSKLLTVTGETLDIASVAMSELPNLLGYNGDKKYIILFQNNNELRPTGGFVGSYAVLYLKEGKIAELTIDDIYNPDGQLDVRGINVSPPDPIKQFLKEEKLYIRNANWDPDFPRSADAITDLFYKLTGEDIAGIFAVDLNFAAKLLDVTGPIFLTAFNEEINSKNLYERTQYHASYNYKEGSQQKREFLTILGSKLLEALFGLSREKTSALGEAITTSLEERHLMMYLFSNALNAPFSERKWTGELVKTNKDYLQVVNANLGGTKSNYYVNETMAYKVTSQTRDGLLRAELTLNYDHTGKDQAWPGGPYTNYVRVLAQKGAKLTGAKIVYDELIEEDIFNKIVISEVNPYTSFETNFVLKPSSKIRLLIYYDLAPQLSITKSSPKYELFWQKQAGTSNDAYSYLFDIPFGMIVKNVDTKLKTSDDKIFTSGTLSKDLTLYIDLE